ncbi:MAG: nucleotidyl transferase AbiEii/AbiGii toxin family protein [Thermoanaerobaculia bacterium]|nr:nucleotidyl transferase AbiEii/AbiGii toxin family protein [Thermoanaerobaculia bacterium]
MDDQPRVDEEQLLAVLRALEEHGVSYAIIGGIALGLHGLARATADLDLFLRPDEENIERLKDALKAVFDDPNIDDISAKELSGLYPAVRYWPPAGFGFDLLTRLGEAFAFNDLEIEEKRFGNVTVPVVTPHTLWRMKKDTVRPIDRIDADRLAKRFGFEDE